MTSKSLNLVQFSPQIPDLDFQMFATEVPFDSSNTLAPNLNNSFHLPNLSSFYHISVKGITFLPVPEA